jgi:hypothetical protein
VELLHKLHDELKYDSLDALTTGIARDCDDARAWFAREFEGAAGSPTRFSMPPAPLHRVTISPALSHDPGRPARPRTCLKPVHEHRQS